MIGQKNYDDCVRLFKTFHGREPRPSEIVLVKPAGDEGALALVVGSALSLGYRALGDGKSYYHEFASTLPKVCVTGDGKQVFLVGGSYTFTDRGFIR
jgi:hypothetical protein